MNQPEFCERDGSPMRLALLTADFVIWQCVATAHSVRVPPLPVLPPADRMAKSSDAMLMAIRAAARPAPPPKSRHLCVNPRCHRRRHGQHRQCLGCILIRRKSTARWLKKKVAQA